ncbi:MAG TPA: COX15/CtaA family protein [Candidatus Polarisedimenticolaceae bacterium]|nr:COX15/CtaA family protein [Candidatus Polarisedimenticolaceae bacterium]
MSDTRRYGDVLALAFGTTVALWAVAYVGRLPVVLAPSSVVLAGLLAVLFLGGRAAGAIGDHGVWGGVLTGASSGLLNLLVLGSFLTKTESPNALVPAAGLFVPGSILVSAAVAGAGALLGVRRKKASREAADWTALLAVVAVAATVLLVVAGGLVTSNKAGLAVADWPTSYGYNMFLYPFSRMTGGIYYEHAHRLLGALVGLTTLTLALRVLFTERRGWVKRLALAALALVVVQGILGGLRVTQTNLYLAVVHGVTAQIFLALLVVIAVVLSRTWRSDRDPERTASAGGDRAIATLAVAALVVQIALGAVQRHLSLGLMMHIVMAFVAAGIAIAAGARAWGFHPNEPILKRLGLLLIYGTGFQLMLGFSAWIVRGAFEQGTMPLDWKVAITTLHQGTGALLLATAVCLRAWEARLLVSEPRLHPEPASDIRGR